MTDEIAAEVAAEALTWAADHPYIDTVRITPLAYLLTRAAPFETTPALSLQTRTTLWIFAIDDLFDHPNAELPDLQRFSADCRGILTRDLPGSGPLSNCLTGLRHELAGYPLFAPLQHLWTSAITTLLRSMLDEATWREDLRRLGPSALPPLTRYLRSARHSIGAPAHMRTVLVTTPDPSTPHHLPHLLRLERHASLAVRLANDLRTHEREATEGNVNAVSILTQTARAGDLSPAAALERARSAVRREIKHHLQHCAELSQNAVTATGDPEGLSRIRCGSSVWLTPCFLGCSAYT
ncbi:terpene synthase family protein [Streptomyces sp. NPDC051555]|uniref:terpene synthase family protein n=1 Tax=Streptomyces sp. NPDC051555 TaxID=3365657 RepID=UPI00379E3B8D